MLTLRRSRSKDLSELLFRFVFSFASDDERRSALDGVLFLPAAQPCSE